MACFCLKDTGMIYRSVIDKSPTCQKSSKSTCKKESRKGYRYRSGFKNHQ
jgi:hypothetical protein